MAIRPEQQLSRARRDYSALRASPLRGRPCGRSPPTAGSPAGFDPGVALPDSWVTPIPENITSRVYMQLAEASKRTAVDAVERLMTGKPAKVTTIDGRKRHA